jgi:CO/xanthine dehydrogenase Mo-binding subunit
MPKNYFNVVGKPVVREDGYEKVTGEALFADDINFPNQLFGVMVRLPVAHAIIKSIDYSPLKNDKNLICICDADDIPGTKKVGTVRTDQPVFSSHKVVTPGDVIAMLVGENKEALRSLIKKVKIEYDELPILSDPCRALEPEAPLIHPEFKTNLIVHHPLRMGSIKRGFEESDFILDQTYTTPAVEHAYIEPESVNARLLPGNRGVYLIGSIQNPFTTRRILSAVLKLPLTKVRVQQATLGGSFGGKDDIMNILAARAAIGALKTGRPVKISYKREESILESYKRHPYIMHYKVGFTKRGKIKAMKIEVLADGGAYASMSPFVTWRTVVQATGPYEIENVWTDVRAVYTNNPYTGAMRGFGSPQPIFAQESLMDEIAYKLNITPDEIRRINGYKTGSILFKKGIGLSLSFRGCSLGAEGIDASAAYLSLQPDGSAYLMCGLAENGQGLRTTYSIIVAEILGMPIENIYYLDHDTSYIGDSGPTVSSRSTLMGGAAVKNAAEKIRHRLEDVLRKDWELPNEAQFIFKNNKITSPSSKKIRVFFKDLCQLAYQQGINLADIGWYPGPKVHWDESVGQGTAYFTYVYGCQVAEVSVNTVTGEVYVDRITAVHDVGKVINLLGAQGQVYGGVTQGTGYGLWEEIYVKDGHIKELNFDQYLIPTSKDIGEIYPVFVEGKDNYGPWGGKSLGEPTLELSAAAIANAIRNAVGQRFNKLPINLEEILLQKKLRPEEFTRGSEK